MDTTDAPICPTCHLTQTPAAELAAVCATAIAAIELGNTKHATTILRGLCSLFVEEQVRQAALRESSL